MIQMKLFKKAEIQNKLDVIKRLKEITTEEELDQPRRQ